MIINFFISAILSAFAFLFLFYLPGILITKILKINLKGIDLHIFSLALGFVAFTLFCFFLDSFKLFYLVIPIILITDIFAIKKINKKDFNDLQINKSTFFFVLLMVLVFSLPMIINLQTDKSIQLSIDAPWHFTLINELIFRFPPQHPNMSGVAITPYHFFADYVIVKTIQILKIDISFIYFQFIPLLTSFLWGFGVYMLVKKWTKNILSSILSVFFTMFAGSFSFILYLLGHRSLSIDSGFGMLQPPLSLVNPPFSMSIVILVFGLFSVVSYLKDNNKSWFIPIAIFFGIAAMFKVYAGMLLFLGLGVLFISRIIKKDFLFIIVIALTLSIFVFTYMRFVGGSGSLVYAPLWAPHDVFNSNLPFFNYSTRIYLYQQASNNLKIYVLELLILGIYLLGNIGTRAIGIFSIIFLKNKREFFLHEFSIMFLTILMFSLILPLFFIQSIKPFEMTQMFNYFLFLLSIISAIGIASFLNIKMKREYKIVLFASFILLTIPSVIVDYKNVVFKKPEIVSGPTYDSYKFLKSKGIYDYTIFQTPPKDIASNYDSVNKWFRQGSDIYLPAFSNKSTYLTNGPILFREDELNERIKFYVDFINFVNLENTNSNFMQTQTSIINSFKKYKIKYIYSRYPLKFNKLMQIYNKEGILIYEFKD